MGCASDFVWYEMVRPVPSGEFDGVESLRSRGLWPPVTGREVPRLFRSDFFLRGRSGFAGVISRIGAMVACRGHNPELRISRTDTMRQKGVWAKN